MKCSAQVGSEAWVLIFLPIVKQKRPQSELGSSPRERWTFPFTPTMLNCVKVKVLLFLVNLVSLIHCRSSETHTYS